MSNRHLHRAALASECRAVARWPMGEPPPSLTSSLMLKPDFARLPGHRAGDFTQQHGDSGFVVNL